MLKIILYIIDTYLQKRVLPRHILNANRRRKYKWKQRVINHFEFDDVKGRIRQKLSLNSYEVPDEHKVNPKMKK